MPYIITVLALIVMGVGFTLFQSNTTTEPEAVSLDTIVEEIRETTSFGTTTSEEGGEEEVAETEDAEETTANNTPPPVTETKPTTPAPSNPTPAPAEPAPSAPVRTSTYTDGTYRTSSTYRTPGGTYTMDVGITVQNDTITASTLSFSKGGGDGYSKRFSGGYQSVIVGQSLDSANLSRVGGASLTTRAFNSALDSIRSQAS
ncbi:MAG: hypothetical protein RLZZ480_44 [Candidatus Parcubacteria bacterium]